MYDKIFKPKKLVLDTGEVVYEKATRTPIVWLIFLGLLIFSLKFTNFQFSVLIERGANFFDMLKKMVPPDTSYLPKVVKPLLDTIKMSFIGSILGSVFAIPFAILASSNIVHNQVINKVVRILFTFLRTLPTLVTALIATYIFGLGTFAGTLAIFIFSLSVLINPFKISSIVTINDIASAITMIAEVPAPTHIIITGPKAILGRLFNTTKNGSDTFDKNLEDHKIIAIIIPKAVPDRNPTIVSYTVTPKCSNKSFCDKFMNVFSILEG